MSFIHLFPSPFEVVFFVFPYLCGTAGKPSVAGISANGPEHRCNLNIIYFIWL